MTINDLYSQTVSAGITLFMSGGRLCYRALKGVLDEQRREVLRNHKTELIEYLSTHLELSPGPTSDRDDPRDVYPSYLEALAIRIETLEAEYAALFGESVPGELETCRELSTKYHFTGEQRLKYLKRYETLAAIECLIQERDQAFADGRTRWTPGPSDEFFKQQC